MTLAALTAIATTLGGAALGLWLLSKGQRSLGLRRLLLGASCLSLLSMVSLSAAYLAGYRINVTDSLPPGIYRASADVPAAPPVGTMVCVLPSGEHAPAALRRGVAAGVLPARWERVQLLKRVGAVAGQTVDYVELGDGTGILTIAGRTERVAALRHQTPAGEALPSVDYPATVEEGEVWLHSDHPKGFDSRYFGPVAIEALQCTAELIWSW